MSSSIPVGEMNSQPGFLAFPSFGKVYSSCLLSLDLLRGPRTFKLLDPIKTDSLPCRTFPPFPLTAFFFSFSPSLPPIYPTPAQNKHRGFVELKLRECFLQGPRERKKNHKIVIK